MSPGRRIVPPLVALLVAACAEEPTTAVTLGGLDEPLDLQLSLPSVSRDLFVTRESVEFGARTVDAQVFGGEAPPEREYPSRPTTPAAAIWNAYTDVGFWPGQLEAWGEHDYSGNKGRVEVTAAVRHDGVVIGSQTGIKEETHLWVFPWAHHIIGNVFINTDSDCGLAADAQTDHSAWWEIAPGTGPSTFAREVLSTFSGRESQPACQPAGGGGGGGGGGTDGGGAESLDYTCWMWFSYDMYTLEILDIHAMWCTGGG